MKLKWNSSQPLTKKLALLLCWKLWEHVYYSQNMPFESAKASWKEWKNQGGAVDRCASNCPCCEYVLNNGEDRDCDICPLIDLWGESPYANSPHCVYSPYSPYRLGNGNIDNKNYAKQIADFAHAKYLEEKEESAFIKFKNYFKELLCPYAIK